jgi:queuine tRNA-ribosyltransferase
VSSDNVQGPGPGEGATGFFSVTHSKGKSGPRVGCLRTAHGQSETPCFLPIATDGTLRGVSLEQAAACGARALMVNAWHVYRQTGPEVLRQAGGVHRLMGWDGVVFTDSGGYQVFSLKDTSQIDDSGVSFALDTEVLTPESAIEIQKHLGSDIMFVLDDCAPYPCDRQRAALAVERTTQWARRSLAAHRTMPARYAHHQELFGIVQGSMREDLRTRSAEEVAELGFGGYGIGGLSIGMPRTVIREMTVLTCEHLPFDRPRHLLGVGLPNQILEGIADGADTFDCVLPIRKAQRGIAHTRHGELRFKLAQPAATRDRPLDTACTCSTCAVYSREQLRLLFKSDKAQAGLLAAIHNLHFYHSVVDRARQAIREGRFTEYMNAFLADWQGAEQDGTASEARASAGS